MKGRVRHSGYSLIELLVVMAIIVLMTGVAVPTLVRSGFFSSDKSRTGARELFAQLRAASLRARTLNTEVALAYQVEAPPTNSLFPNGMLNANLVPADYVNYVATEYNGMDITDPDQYDPLAYVLTGSMLVRRLTIEELSKTEKNVPERSLALAIIQELPTIYGDYDALKTNAPFVPLNRPFTGFQEFPQETAVLINHPRFQEIEAMDDDESALKFIVVIAVDDSSGTYEINHMRQTDVNNIPLFGDGTVPGHIFKTSGALLTNTGSKQRIVLPVGLKPDARYYDRYMVDENTDRVFSFEEFYDAAADTDSPYYQNYDLVGIETDVTIYVPTGRVAVEGDDGT